MDNHAKVLLLDFYGGLLTAKQYECMDLHCNEDLSFAEIAEQLSISRQGVFDLVKRAQDILLKTEQKLAFIKKFNARLLAAERVMTVLNQMKADQQGKYVISQEVMHAIKNEVNQMIDGGTGEEL
ncbi:MAG: hypothetical protein WCL54_00635 [Clostridia bacterium]